MKIDDIIYEIKKIHKIAKNEITKFRDYNKNLEKLFEIE